MEIKLTADWLLNNQVSSWHYLEDGTIDLMALDPERHNWIILALTSLGVEWYFREGFNIHGCYEYIFNVKMDDLKNECPLLYESMTRGGNNKGAEMKHKTVLYEYSPKSFEIKLSADFIINAYADCWFYDEELIEIRVPDTGENLHYVNLVTKEILQHEDWEDCIDEEGNIFFSILIDKDDVKTLLPQSYAKAEELLEMFGTLMNPKKNK